MRTLASHRRARSRRGGHILVTVTILGVLAAGAWALGFASVNDLIRAERRALLVQRRADGVLPALGQGLRLLETGLPPEDPYACVVTIAGNPQALRCVVNFASQGGMLDWHVSARPAGEDDLATLPDAPSSFAQERPRADKEAEGDRDQDKDKGKDKGQDKDKDKDRDRDKDRKKDRDRD